MALKNNTGGGTTSGTTSNTTAAKANTTTTTSSTASKGVPSGAIFPSDVKFADRGKTPEEIAQNMGEKANAGNLVVLTIFGAISGIFLLGISIYMSHIEALNAAEIISAKDELISKTSQYAISIGLSLASTMFSVIGFQQLARWWKYKAVQGFLPALVKDNWMKEKASETLYHIMLQVIAEGRKDSGLRAVIFLLANLLCSALVLWAVISALPDEVGTYRWIYTLANSLLAFISGACISLLTSADITENSIVSMAQKRWIDYAKAQQAADEILGKA